MEEKDRGSGEKEEGKGEERREGKIIKRRQWEKGEKGGEIFVMLACSLGLNTGSSNDQLYSFFKKLVLSP